MAEEKTVNEQTAMDAKMLAAFDSLVKGDDYGSGSMDALKEDLHNAGCRGDMLGQIQIRRMMARVQDAINRRKEREAHA